MNDFYTIAEVCELLNVSRQTINNWIKKGKIEYLKIDKAVRIPKAQFEIGEDK